MMEVLKEAVLVSRSIKYVVYVEEEGEGAGVGTAYTLNRLDACCGLTCKSPNWREVALE